MPENMRMQGMTMATKKKSTHFINIMGKKRIYFSSYSDAKDYAKTHWPMKANGTIGEYHIYPVDKSVYFSKSVGRISLGEGNVNRGRR